MNKRKIFSVYKPQTLRQEFIASLPVNSVVHTQLWN